MIESIMYFGGGFLVASLLALVLISLVHHRAVRLTTRRFEDSIPLSMAEIQADKDNLRAEFAVMSRRLEVNLEQLKAKSTSQLSEIARKAEAINRLKAELADKNSATDSLDARTRALADRLRDMEQAHAVKVGAVESMTQTLDAKNAELATAQGELSEHRLAADTQRVEIAVLKTQLEQFRSQVDELQVEATDTGRRLVDERAALANASKELEEKRRTIDILRPQLAQLEGEIVAHKETLDERARNTQTLQTHIGEQDRQLAQRDGEARGLNQEIGRLNAEKTSLEGLLEAARNAVATHAARIDELDSGIGERDRLIGQRDAEAKALNQQIADIKDDHATALERIGSEKTSVERLLQTANHTMDTRGARIADLEKWIGERDILVGQRDAEIASLHGTIETIKLAAVRAADALRAETASVEARLAQTIEAMKAAADADVEAVRAEMAAVEARLAEAIEARDRTDAALVGLQQEAEATWRAEKREHVLLRERLSGVAALVAQMTMQKDKSGQIEAILTKSAAPAPQAFEREAPDVANLTQRIRELQNGGSQVATTP
jgi:chromosome segregation ATPase